MPELVHKRRSSYRDVPERQMDYFFRNRELRIELVMVLNFLDCESGCTFA